MVRVFVYWFISTSLFVSFFFLVLSSITKPRYAYLYSFLLLILCSSIYISDISNYTVLFSSVNSEKLWSVPLPSPQHSLRRILPYPKYTSLFFRVNVRINSGFVDDSHLYFSINGGEPSPFTYAGFISSFKFPEPYYYIQEGRFLSETISFGKPIEVTIWQGLPDPLLRVVVWGDSSGATYLRESSWFGFEDRWFVGVPSARTGQPVDGFPMIWIDNFD